MLTSIVGINWGDEGKGRMVDLLSSDYDVVCRYQGGNNAGHTVINERGKFILNLLPSGILRENVTCVMGPGMVVDIRHLAGEMRRLREAGVKISPENLKISDRAVVTMPYNVAQDCLEEERLADKKFGSTKRGIAPVYADKYLKKAFRMGELKEWDSARKSAFPISWTGKISLLSGRVRRRSRYESVDRDPALFRTVRRFRFPTISRDTGLYPERGAQRGEKDHASKRSWGRSAISITASIRTPRRRTPSRPTRPIGAGVPESEARSSTIGIMKAYSTCVGEGPFTAEYFGEKAHTLREAGGEYGAATGQAEKGRPVRRGRVALRDPHARGRTRSRSRNSTYLSGLRRRLEICTAYRVGRQKTDRVSFPRPARFLRAGFRNGAKGWNRDISACRKKGDLPKEALAYIARLEEECACKIRYVSVGAERDAFVEM